MEENAAAAEIVLGSDELAEIDKLFRDKARRAALVMITTAQKS
ncbi:MAG TPA: hypothetical protein VMR88_05620 [Candidatus Polarisedimenticolaceae bacterium]|nr:hypothetical protein [Candidatus Polarisedimenticolaceae bacterium]